MPTIRSPSASETRLQTRLEENQERLKLLLSPILARTRKEFGLAFCIPPCFTVTEVLKQDDLLRLFLPGAAAWVIDRGYYQSDLGQSPITVKIDTNYHKRSILREIATIVDARQTGCANPAPAMANHNRRLGKKDKPPDSTLFRRYVEAFELRENGAKYKDIAKTIFPREVADAALQKARLYARNGQLVLRGQSYRVSER